MPKATPLINSFNAGELSPQIDVRSDVDKYYSGCRTLKNFIPLIEGGAKRIPGTYYVAEVADSDVATRLVPFHFSTTQAYVLEFSENVIRVYKDEGQVLDGPNPVEITTTYAEADLFELKFLQSADTLYIFHPDYPPKKLSRTSHIAWTFTDMLTSIQDAMTITGATKANPCVISATRPVPDPDTNLPMTITAATKANPCVLTVQRPTSIDFPTEGNIVYITGVGGMTELNGNFFTVTNCKPDNSQFSLSGIDSTGYGAFTSGGSIYISDFKWPENDDIVYIADVVGMTQINDLFFTVAGSNEAAGTFQLSGINSSAYTAYTSGGTAQKQKYGTTDNCPSCGTFFEQRMCLGGSNDNPQRFNMSVSADYENFTETADEDDSAIQFTLVSRKADRILWMEGHEVLAIGTSGGVWKVGATSSIDPLTATNVTARKPVSIGTKNIQPEVVGDVLLWVTRSGTRLRQFSYNFSEDKWIAPDMTRIAKHIALGDTLAESGIVDMDFQNDPIPILWCVRADGQLLGLSYDAQENVYAWFRLVDATGSYESVAVLTEEDEEDQVWVVVNRTIDGETARYVEYFMPHNFFSIMADCFFVHSGLTWEGTDALTVEAISQADPCVVTVDDATDVTAGDKLKFYNTGTWLDDHIVTAHSKSGNDITIYNEDDDDGIISTNFDDYDSGGTVRTCIKEIDGLDHLEGEEVDILGNGAVIPSETVSSGAITMDFYCVNKVHVGLGFESVVEPMKLAIKTDQGTSRGKKQKINKLTLAFFESRGGKYGVDVDNLFNIPFGTGGTPTLLTDDIDVDFEGNWDNEATIVVVQDQPLPMTLLGIVPRISVNED